MRDKTVAAHMQDRLCHNVKGVSIVVSLEETHQTKWSDKFEKLAKISVPKLMG